MENKQETINEEFEDNFKYNEYLTITDKERLIDIFFQRIDKISNIINQIKGW